MLFRMIRGVLFHQKGKMLLIAVTIALGASLATGMLNVVMDVEDKVNKELKNYGANITVKPKDASLLSDIYDVGEGGAALNAAYLREDELGRLKTIFWAFNIVDFTPFLDTQATLPDGDGVKVVGGEMGGDDSGIVVSESGVTKCWGDEIVGYAFDAETRAALVEFFETLYYS